MKKKESRFTLLSTERCVCVVAAAYFALICLFLLPASRLPSFREFLSTGCIIRPDFACRSGDTRTHNIRAVLFGCRARVSGTGNPLL